MNINGFEIEAGVLVGYTGDERDIVLPREVKEIGDQAFFKQIRIKSIIAKYALQRIGSQAFFDCVSLKEVSLTGGVKEIASDAFWGCTALAEVTLPKEVALIEGDAFGGCENLKTIKFHGTEQDWNAIQRADDWADGVENIAVLLLKEKRTIYPCGVPDGVTVELSAEQKEAIRAKENADKADKEATIKKYQRNKVLFLVLSILSFLVAVAMIGIHAFLNEMSFNYLLVHMGLVIVPLGLALALVILSAVFSAMKNKKEGLSWNFQAGFLHFSIVFLTILIAGASVFSYVYGHSGTKYSHYKDGFFFSLNGVETARVTGVYESKLSENVVIPTSIEGYAVDQVDHDAFESVKDKSKIKSVKLPDTIKDIGSNAFEGMENLTSIDLPKGLKSIGERAFMGCGLTSLTLPESIQRVGADAFYCCPIKELVFPVNLTRAYEMGFSYNSLETITFYGEGEIGKWLFEDYYNVKTLIIEEGVTAIGEQAFYRCDSLSTLVLPQGLTVIDDDAFAECLSLTTVILPDGLTEIGDYAFINCPELADVSIPATVEKIGARPFDNASSRLKITFRGTLEEWEAIRRESRAASTVVHCTDGDGIWW